MLIENKIDVINWYNIQDNKILPKSYGENPVEQIKNKTGKKISEIYNSGWIFVEAINDYLLIKGTPEYVKRLLKRFYKNGFIKRFSIIEIITPNSKKIIADEDELKKYLKETSAGLIVKGVNTTSDVDLDSIKVQSKKLGMNVSRQGVPNLDYRKSIEFVRKNNNYKKETLSEQNPLEKIDSIINKSFINIDVKNIDYNRAKEIFDSEPQVFKLGNNILGVKTIDSMSFWKKDENNWIVYEHYISSDKEKTKMFEHLNILKNSKITEKVKLNVTNLSSDDILKISFHFSVKDSENRKILESFVQDYKELLNVYLR